MNDWPPAVLLAAHQDIMRHAVRQMLRNCGIDALSLASTCEDAYAIVARDPRRVDVLIIDVGLPDSLELVKKIREKDEGIPKILFISPQLTREEIQDATLAGVDDLLVYPFSQEVVEKKIRRLIEVS